MSVTILPFVSDKQGLPISIGVIKEKNPFREGGQSISLISGTSEDEDPDLLTTAKRELLRESGFDASDNKRWYYLGAVTSAKFIDHEQPCFAVDVTDLPITIPKVENTKIKKENEFKFIPANDIVKSKDIFIPGLFMKLFKYVLGMDIQSQGEDSKQDKGFNFSI